MRKLLIFFLFISLLLALPACAAQAPPESLAPAPPTAEPTPAEEVTPPTPEAQQEPQQVELPIPLPHLEMQLTEEPERYRPTPTIVPLTNAARIYSNCVVGEITFIRAADQSRVELPPGLANYAAVRAEEDGSVIAYALLNQDYKMAFMSVDGKMLTDFVYDTFGEDSYMFPNRYGYVTVMRYDENWNQKCGLLDLRNGQEVIPLEYDDPYSFQPLQHAVLAQKDGQYQFLDYTGQLLFECAKRPNISSGMELGDPWYYYFYDPEGSGYTYLPASGEIFSFALPEGESILLYGGMTIHAADYWQEITAYNQWGEVIFTGDGISRNYASGGALLLYTDGNTAIELVRPSGSLSVEIPAMAGVDSTRFSALAFGGAHITFTYEDEADSCLQHSIIYDLQGAELSRSSEYAYDAQSHTRDRSLPQNSQQLEDGQGHIIIPFGNYGYINTYGAFLIGSSATWGSPDFDILDLQGKLLLHNPLGAIVYENGLADRMVVWPDAKTCEFLYPDGRTEPIANPPQIERKYFGG